MNSTLDLLLDEAPVCAKPVAQRAPCRKGATVRPASAQDSLFTDDFSAAAAPRAFDVILIENALARLNSKKESEVKAVFESDIPAVLAATTPERFEDFIRTIEARIHEDFLHDFAWSIESWGAHAGGRLRDLVLKLANNPESSGAAWAHSAHWLNGDTALVAEFSTSTEDWKRRRMGYAIHSPDADHICTLRPETVEELAAAKDKHLARDARFAAVRLAGRIIDGELPRPDLLARMEAVIAKSSEHTMLHCDWNLHGRFVAGEAAIADDGNSVWSYAKEFLGIDTTGMTRREVDAAFEKATGIRPREEEAPKFDLAANWEKALAALGLTGTTLSNNEILAIMKERQDELPGASDGDDDVFADMEDDGDDDGESEEEDAE